MSMFDLHKRALGAIGRMKASHGLGPDRSALVAPDKVPATIEPGNFPKDFSHYKYLGPAIETVNYPLPDGSIEKRRGLVAELALFQGDEAHSRITMTASTRDLENGGYSGAAAIASSLNDYYGTKVQHNGGPQVLTRHQQMGARSGLKANATVAPASSTHQSPPTVSSSQPSLSVPS